MSDFELQMVQHGAPTLYGIKQASLFSLPLGKLVDYKKEIQVYQKALQRKGISLLHLYCCENRMFFLLYRKDALLSYLAQPEVKAFLVGEGYGENLAEEDGLVQTLCFLRHRVRQSKDFPHEIGFFLGYPVEDVFAFIQEKGKNYKFTGYWKVYGDEEFAHTMFQKYTDCRNRMLEVMTSGAPLLYALEEDTFQVAV